MTNLAQQYESRLAHSLTPVAKNLERFLNDTFGKCVRIDRICTRPKSAERFLAKAAKVEDGKQKYTDPLNQIQDQIGARIVTFYPSDVTAIAKEVEKYFRPIETKSIVPDSENEFGYVGQHFILLLPKETKLDIDPKEEIPNFFELQIKTLFQHAWSEAEHDLGYKPAQGLTSLQKRKMAFTAAQAWGADMIFDQLFKEIAGTKIEVR